MRKFTVLSFLFFFSFSSSHADMLDIAYWTSKEFGQKLKDARDEIYKDTMIKQTIDSLGVLKRNYQEATSFYAEMKRAQENPNELLQDSLDAFWSGFGNPEEEVKSKIDASSQREKGILGKMHDKALAKTLSWMDENIAIADWVKDKVQKHNKSLEKAATGLNSNNKETVESSKNLLLLLSANVLVNQERMLANLLKQFSEQAKKEYSNNLDFMKLQKDMVDAIDDIYSNQPYYRNEGDRKKDLLNKIGEIPRKPNLQGAVR